MKNKKPNAEHIWKQFEDLLVPRLRLSVIDRAVYSHLLRHSRLALDALASGKLPPPLPALANPLPRKRRSVTSVHSVNSV